MISIKLIENEVLKLDVRSNVDRQKLTLYGLLTTIVLSKELFQKNKDIKLFTSAIGLDNLGEYLFKNRTALLAKVSRELEKMDNEQVKELIHLLKKYFDNDDRKNKSNNISTDDIISRFTRG